MGSLVFTEKPDFFSAEFYRNGYISSQGTPHSYIGEQTLMRSVLMARYSLGFRDKVAHIYTNTGSCEHVSLLSVTLLPSSLSC